MLGAEADGLQDKSWDYVSRGAGNTCVSCRVTRITGHWTSKRCFGIDIKMPTPYVLVGCMYIHTVSSR